MGPTDPSSLSKSALRFNTFLPSAAKLGVRAWDDENGEAFISL